MSRTNADRRGRPVQPRDVTFRLDRGYLIHELKRYRVVRRRERSRRSSKTLDPDKARVIVIKANKEGIKGDKARRRVVQTKVARQGAGARGRPEGGAAPADGQAELKALDNAIRYELGSGMKVVLLPVERDAAGRGGPDLRRRRRPLDRPRPGRRGEARFPAPCRSTPEGDTQMTGVGVQRQHQQRPRSSRRGAVSSSTSTS